MEQSPRENTDNNTNRKKWLKRLGIAGFLFFLVKGLGWLAVIIFAWKGCGSGPDQSTGHDKSTNSVHIKQK